MKAISLIQPWATLIALGAKTIETRMWGTQYRGNILIAASKKRPPKEMLYWGFEILIKRGIIEDQIEFQSLTYPLGKVLCVAEIVACRPMTTTDEQAALCEVTPGRMAWVLRNIRQIKPFDIKGALGLYEVPKVPGVCRMCGCTDYVACDQGCRWVEDDLCSNCFVPIKKQLA